MQDWMVDHLAKWYKKVTLKTNRPKSTEISTGSETNQVSLIKLSQLHGRGIQAGFSLGSRKLINLCAWSSPDARERGAIQTGASYMFRHWENHVNAWTVTHQIHNPHWKLVTKCKPVVDPVTASKSKPTKDEQESFQKDMSSQPVIPKSSTAAFYA